MIKGNPSKWEYLRNSILKRKRTKICITCNHFRYSTTETFATVLICPKYEKRIPQGDHYLKAVSIGKKIGRYFPLKHLNYSLIQLL